MCPSPPLLLDVPALVNKSVIGDLLVIDFKQIGAPTVPSAVIIGSIEDFQCHKHVKVSHDVTMCNIYFIS
jgi:hypothetical protein